MFRDNPKCVFLLLAGLTNPVPHTLRPLTGSWRTRPPHMAHGSDTSNEFVSFFANVLVDILLVLKVRPLTAQEGRGVKADSRCLLPCGPPCGFDDWKSVITAQASECLKH
jgi:hypothetical protein